MECGHEETDSIMLSTKDTGLFAFIFSNIVNIF